MKKKLDQTFIDQAFYSLLSNTGYPCATGLDGSLWKNRHINVPVTF
ncbi:MAG: hypothetical protein KME60_19740 [Cyanomargarita calcarea GSE-NOS-MK-12-04C]|uniref:Uncharacterized protein n=1 Tax=Cyanomargarita calcarea GSE-NOS-MK-12-04C TaxID=2839659 RepID=A0A951UUH6_9CYAN|nr:hypothetical protein [Cyanomargarita calcarea GSE-NOS-MK-12-04C]